MNLLQTIPNSGLDRQTNPLPYLSLHHFFVPLQCLPSPPLPVHALIYISQYTKKIYHIASKLPGWLRAVLPTKATELHEEAWNALVFPTTSHPQIAILTDRAVTLIAAQF